MKALKLLSILIPTVILTTIIFSSGCSPKTKNNLNSKKEVSTQTSNTDNTTNPVDDSQFISVPAATIGLAEIIYPTNDGETVNICTENRADLFSLDGGSTICGIQGLLSQNQYGNYLKEGFCDCFTQFCGETTQAADFINCIKAHKQTNIATFRD